MTTSPENGYDEDVLDFDAPLADPRFAAAVEDAATRFDLVAELVGLRKRAGLSQKQVAAEMETTQSFVSDFENGRTDPHLSTFQRYARAVASRLVVTSETPTDCNWVRWSAAPTRPVQGRVMTSSPVTMRSDESGLGKWAQASPRAEFALSA